MSRQSRIKAIRVENINPDPFLDDSPSIFLLRISELSAREFIATVGGKNPCSWFVLSTGLWNICEENTIDSDIMLIRFCSQMRILIFIGISIFL